MKDFFADLFDRSGEEEERWEEEDVRVQADSDDLLFLGYLESTVDIGDHTFVIRTLNTDQEMACLALCRELREEVLPLEYERALVTSMLGGAILSLDGEPLYHSLGHEPESAVLRAKVAKIRQWHWPLHQHLFLTFEQLEARKRAAFDDLVSKSQRTLSTD